jgi:hypothetical protein
MKRTFTLSRAQEIGQALGIDFSKVNAEEFRMGLAVELEHGTADPLTDVTHDDLMLTGKIAWAHLREFPDYYTRLAKLEAEADQYWTAHR